MADLQCTELLSEPDNIEYIRDQIAAILASETANQYELAKEAEDAAARDYKIGVYVENDDPIQYVDKSDNPFPLVNITLAKTERAEGSTSVNKRIMEATFFLDVYATGNMESGEDAGARASLKAWKTARIIRNILNAENYAYFLMRGVVTGRDIMSFEAGEPANSNSAVRVKMIRITLNVDYIENVAITEGEELTLITAKILDYTGEVIAEF